MSAGIEEHGYWAVARHADDRAKDTWFGPFTTEAEAHQRIERLWDELDGSTDPDDNFDAADVHHGPPPWPRTTYQVEVSRTISVIVTVQADTAEAAGAQVDSLDYPLPPRDEWTGHKDWRLVVRDTDGNELLEVER